MAVSPNFNIKINTKWSKWDECYITGSPDYPNIVAAGDTEKESEKLFFEFIADHIEYQKKRKLLDQKKKKTGRPRKNNTPLSVNISPEIRGFLSATAIEWDVNIGLALERIVREYAKDHPEETHAYLLDQEYDTFISSLSQ